MSFARNPSNIYGKNLLDNAAKVELGAAWTAFKKVVHKTAEATAE